MYKLIFVAVLLLATPVAHAAQANVIPLVVPSGVVQVGSPQVIRWQSSNFPLTGKVDINLMRQVSVSPRTFVLVRQIVTGIPNTGMATWTPMQSDVGTNMYVQIACSLGTVFKDGCVSIESNTQVAVSGGSTLAAGNANTQTTANILLALYDALAALLKFLQ